MAIGSLRSQESVSVVCRGLALYCSSDENQGDRLYPALHASAGRGHLLWVLHQEAMDGPDPLPAHAIYYSAFSFRGHWGGRRIRKRNDRDQPIGLPLHSVSCHPDLPEASDLSGASEPGL